MVVLNEWMVGLSLRIVFANKMYALVYFFLCFLFWVSLFYN
jgi:hypothetical protein